ncbi:hypothetical protein DPMN_021762 [Dreissena polymorpha]|uniref:Uncharacterized protein n=1 Tax=Dreissena polymorpha TaxID=45954 RepID=A0A9D4NPH3_DREPO|nr:hypothetical protein DPMN_021762 [Dreissena polymorpha]
MKSELLMITSLPSGGHVFQQTETIFKLIQDIIKTNVLTKFHNDWTLNVISRVKKCPSPGGHVFQPTRIIFELVQDVIRTILQTKLHEDPTINVALRVKCPALWQPCFSNTVETNLLTKFYEDWTIDMALRVLTRQMMASHNARHTDNGQKVITKAHHEHTVLNTICKNLLTKFHEDWTICGASRVLTRQMLMLPNTQLKMDKR